ncbi:MAG: 23S rRNA (pseudouridine(1915)-N(3))-methyltransferase RlmH [Blautia sp.]|nr:23S rRNA (pseudouridine(1915)-N(3))-methyltransferase RlmH [Blautia sp.]
MVSIRILSVGKIKEKYLKDAIAEYAKRLGRYCRLDFVQVPDEKTPDEASPAEEELILTLEGKRLLKLIREKDYCIALAIQGEALASTELAQRLDRLLAAGKSSLVFVIGGSLGLSREVLSRADWKLSFSRLTFPHQLMQVILLEQIYRSFRILSGEPYHK